jgi:hypothetical protein
MVKMNTKGFVLLLLIALLIVVPASATYAIYYPTNNTQLSRESVDQTLTQISTSAGTGLTYDTQLTTSIQASSSNNYVNNWRTVFIFDTSGLPNDAVIQDAKLVLYGVAKSNAIGNPTLGFTGATISNYTHPVISDYNKTTTNIITTNVTYAGFQVMGTNTFTFVNTTYINKTGYTAMWARLTWDTDNTFSGSYVDWSTSGFNFFTMVTPSGANTTPKLYINYTSASEDNPNFTRYGTVLTADTPWEQNYVFEPVVLYDTDPQILTGNTSVYKMWYTGGWGTHGLGYAESINGVNWTKHPSNPILQSGARLPEVLKNGSIYYLYVSTNGNSTRYNSTNGINWTQDKLDFMLPGVANTNVWIDTPGKWHMLYEYLNGGETAFQIGYANSSDGKTWTTYAGNPVISGTGSRGGTSDLWVNGATNSVIVHGANLGYLPTNLLKYDSADYMTWTVNPNYYIMIRTGSDEGEGLYTGQMADPFLVERTGTKFLYYHATNDGNAGSTSGTIKLATTNGLDATDGVDITAPRSITGLTNSTVTNNSIMWTWTNPTDTDFNHTVQYKNGVLYYNSSNSTAAIIWTGLTNNTAYTFSSHTVDITGNMNATWVNATATTNKFAATPSATTTSPFSVPVDSGAQMSMSLLGVFIIALIGLGIFTVIMVVNGGSLEPEVIVGIIIGVVIIIIFGYVISIISGTMSTIQI